MSADTGKERELPERAWINDQMNEDREPVVSADTEAHIVTDEREEILATYNLCLIGPSSTLLFNTGFLNEVLNETEENLTDLLPDGYRVVIREWSSSDE